MSKILPIINTSTAAPPALASSAAAPPAPPAPDSMLIGARRFAELLNLSKATIDRMKAAGKLPRHIELSRGCHRWRLSEVRDWIDAGCSPIKEWEMRRRADNGGAR